MSKDNWYRNTIWNEELEREFENRLKRARNKIYPVYIQGVTLLMSKQEEFHPIGAQFLERMILEDPDNVNAKQQLATYYLKNKKYDKAEVCLKDAIEYWEKQGQKRATYILIVELTDVILRSNQKTKYEELYKSLTTDIEKIKYDLLLRNCVFYYLKILAFLCDKLGKEGEAVVFAKEALELADIKEPQFSRHKGVGEIDITEEEFKKLTELATY